MISEAKRKWNEENAERRKLHSAVYRARLKGVEPPPEVLEAIERFKAITEARKAENAAKEKEKRKAWRDNYKDRKAERFKERLATDPEFREKVNARARARYAKKQKEAGVTKEETLRRRREALNKARKVANSLRHARAVERAKERKEQKEREKQAKALSEMRRKPGRLIALLGWRGW